MLAQPYAVEHLPMAEVGANIVDMSLERMSFAFNAKRAALDLAVELRDTEPDEKVLSALRARGFDVTARGRPSVRLSQRPRAAELGRRAGGSAQSARSTCAEYLAG